VNPHSPGNGGHDKRSHTPTPTPPPPDLVPQLVPVANYFGSRKYSSDDVGNCAMLFLTNANSMDGEYLDTLRQDSVDTGSDTGTGTGTSVASGAGHVSKSELKRQEEERQKQMKQMGPFIMTKDFFSHFGSCLKLVLSGLVGAVVDDADAHAVPHHDDPPDAKHTNTKPRSSHSRQRRGSASAEPPELTAEEANKLFVVELGKHLRRADSSVKLTWKEWNEVVHTLQSMLTADDTMLQQWRSHALGFYLSGFAIGIILLVFA
jgi:hypothetical protein